MKLAKSKEFKKIPVIFSKDLDKQKQVHNHTLIYEELIPPREKGEHCKITKMEISLG